MDFICVKFILLVKKLLDIRSNVTVSPFLTAVVGYCLNAEIRKKLFGRVRDFVNFCQTYIFVITNIVILNILVIVNHIFTEFRIVSVAKPKSIGTARTYDLRNSSRCTSAKQ